MLIFLTDRRSPVELEPLPEPSVSYTGWMTSGQQQRIGVGMLGYAFMGKAHAGAYRALPHLPDPPSLIPELISLAGRNEAAVAEAADRYGFAEHTGDWRGLIADDRIGLLDNAGPNRLHAEPTIAAAQAGKHVICEKPLGLDAEESYRIWQSVAATGVVHLCAFNYRFVPAVRLAREMIEAGELGEIHHFRASYLQDWLADPEAPMAWRLSRAEAGSGALGDIGAHAIDMARYLVGEIATVSGTVRTFVRSRPGGEVDVDDAFAAAVEFDRGAIGTIEASRFATGRRNQFRWEINGSRGSIAFDLERLNELDVHLVGSQPGGRAQGFRRVLVSEPDHPFWHNWWPPGHIIGWEHTFIHELDHLLGAIAGRHQVRPHGADFQDGYRAAEVCDAVVRSSAAGERMSITYRD
jgi:predicted dehydrogenase